MPTRTLTAAAALAAAAAVSAVIHHNRQLKQRLAREAAASRLTAGCRTRDLDAFRTRLEGLLSQQAVVDEAEQVLDAALAVHTNHIDPQSGGGSS